MFTEGISKGPEKIEPEKPEIRIYVENWREERNRTIMKTFIKLRDEAGYDFTIVPSDTLAVDFGKGTYYGWYAINLLLDALVRVEKKEVQGNEEKKGRLDDIISSWLGARS